jgi:hypothetical protein
MKELFTRNNIVSRAINAENRTGMPGEGGKASSALGVGRKGSPCLKDIKSGETETLAYIEGCGIIRHIWITVDNKTDDSNRFVLRDLILRMYWDGEESPSVECPLGDFFALGFGETYEVYSSLITVIPSRGLNSYIQMPFRKNARITIENQHDNPIPAFFYQIDYTLGDELSDDTLYFHASWNRENPTVIGRDYTILDNVKGEGTYLGTTLYLSSLSRYWWGEGEIKFYIDDDTSFPTICGTGTEDYFGGSWSFARHEDGKTIETNYNSQYLGYPFYSRDDRDVYNPYHNSECPPMRAFYRWHVKDPVFFKKSLKVTIQQIGVCYSGLFERSDDVSSVAYWYQTEPHAPFKALPEKKERWPR